MTSIALNLLLQCNVLLARHSWVCTHAYPSHKLSLSAVPSPSSGMHPATPEKQLRSSLETQLRAQGVESLCSLPLSPVHSTICTGTSLIHAGPSVQPTGFKGSPANTLRPETAVQPQIPYLCLSGLKFCLFWHVVLILQQIGVFQTAKSPQMSALTSFWRSQSTCTSVWLCWVMPRIPSRQDKLWQLEPSKDIVLSCLNYCWNLKENNIHMAQS